MKQTCLTSVCFKQSLSCHGIALHSLRGHEGMWHSEQRLYVHIKEFDQESVPIEEPYESILGSRRTPQEFLQSCGMW